MEFVTAIIIEPLVNIVMLPITDRLRYMMFCRKYVRDMRSKMSELEVTRADVEDHMNRNTRSRLEIPSQVRGWLDEVEGINANVQNFPSDAIGCFNLNIRHKLGRKALKITDEIESFTRQKSQITWTDRPIPLGKIDSMKASTSTPSTDHNDFQSREETFVKALKALEPNNNSHMIALWGMGGVGKTTMMQRLKKVVQEKKMFSYIVEAVIKEEADPIDIQDAIADYLSVELNEKTKPARADKLRQGFKEKSEGGKKNFFVILDDVWQSVDLEDIGLSPLPNQGVDFKVLLTSRNKDVCIRMGVEDNLILDLKGLTEAEAQSFFRQFLQISDDVDNELHKIGEDIVKKCCGLPIAIKTIAYTLKGGGKHIWEDALARLQHHDIYDVVNEVFEISYKNLQDQESKAIFLLCGLFPEDYNIPIEDLMRYGWGLKLFNRVHTIREARNRLNTCIDRLIHKNLLMETEVVGCVKMHDLALSFVLNMFSNVECDVIVNHGSRPGWPEENDMSNSCKRFSLTCQGMTEIPSYLKFPHLSILKLRHGDKSLRFPENFYGEMEKVQVISYHNLRYPLLPSSLHCSPNLRVLHLHHCSLMMFDCSSIGNLSNLEVLSFASSHIELLPSTIGNLEKLMLLDLTDCGGLGGLRVEKGALINLLKLEELYMMVSKLYRTSINFTEDNCNEIAERLKNLSSLEFELFGNNSQLKNMSFANLERFKISVGRSFDGSYGKSKHSFGNMLQLATKKDELLDAGLNDLFEKTEVLCLSVEDMNDLGDLEVKSSHLQQSCSFQNLRVFVVSKCVELRYLFTLGVANTLSKLENLEVYECDNMEEVIHTGGCGEDTIIFPKLKFLCLGKLPKLLGLCHDVSQIQLPQLVTLKLDNIPGFTSIYPKNKLKTSSFLKEEVVIPNLEKLHINHMEDLKEIWPCEFGPSEDVNVSLLRRIEVMNCDSIVNLFPCNPMPFTDHLEELVVRDCGSIEVLFNIELDSVGEIGEGSNLRSVEVCNLSELREVWRIKGADNSRLPINGFQAVKSVKIEKCRRFRNIFTPITANFDLGALMDISIQNSIEDRRKDERAEWQEWFKSIREEEDKLLERSQQGEFSEAGGVSWSLCQYAKEISIKWCAALSSVIPCYAAGQMQKLQLLRVWSCHGMKEVFETQGTSGCDEVNGGGPQQAIPRQNHAIMLKLHNLKILGIIGCHGLEHVLPFSALGSLGKLEQLEIRNCEAMKVIVKEEEESSKEVVVFPCLKSIQLYKLPNLKGFFLGMNKFQWRSLDKVTIYNCPEMTVFAPGGSTAPHLKYMHTTLGKHTLGECGLNFHAHVTDTEHHQTPLFPSLDGSSSCPATSEEKRPWSFHNLIELHVHSNDDVEKIIPSNELLKLQNLEKIHVINCFKVEEVFEEAGRNSSTDESQTTTTTTLVTLPNLRHIYFGDLPCLRYMWKSNQWTVFQFPNLTTIFIDKCHSLKHVFSSSMVGSLLQLQDLSISECEHMEEVIVKDSNDGVEEEEESDAKTNQIITLPRLKSLYLLSLPSLKGFCLGKEDFSFPLLDTLTFRDCPAITTFTNGHSATPKLREIQIQYDRFYAGEDINSSFIKINQEELKKDW